LFHSQTSNTCSGVQRSKDITYMIVPQDTSLHVCSALSVSCNCELTWLGSPALSRIYFVCIQEWL